MRRRAYMVHGRSTAADGRRFVELEWVGYLLAACLAMYTLGGQSAAAGAPSAIVEEISAEGSEVRFMDFVEAGDVIELGSSGSVVLGYMQSCRRETISGGQVTIGAEKSTIRGGRVDVERVACDGESLALSPARASQSAVIVMRRPPSSTTSTLPQARLTIYDASPMLAVTNGATRVSIQRLDRPDERIEVNIDGRHADLATREVALSPGGLYRARAGERTVVFRVDPFAGRQSKSIIGRIIRF